MKRSLLVLVAVAALVVPSTALANGVVLKVQRGAHEVAVATSPSRVALVHTNARLAVGQRVAFTTHGAKVIGRAHNVRFRGLLVARTQHAMLLSAGGAVMSVRRDDHHGDPRRGAIVEVNATVGANGALDDNDNPVVVTPAALGGRIEGTLTIGADSITVTGDELNLAIKVPVGTNLGAFRNGDDVEATFAQGTDGTLTLTKLELRRNNDDNDDNDHHDDGGGHHHGGHGHG
jgi:hypothetical protein